MDACFPMLHKMGDMGADAGIIRYSMHHSILVDTKPALQTQLIANLKLILLVYSIGLDIGLSTLINISATGLHTFWCWGK